MGRLIFKKKYLKDDCKRSRFKFLKDQSQYYLEKRMHRPPKKFSLQGLLRY